MPETGMVENVYVLPMGELGHFIALCKEYKLTSTHIIQDVGSIVQVSGKGNGAEVVVDLGDRVIQVSAPSVEILETFAHAYVVMLQKQQHQKHKESQFLHQ